MTGLTQREFAKLIGANHITVSKWENGARRPSRVALRLLDLVACGTTECMDALKRSAAREKRLRGGPASRRAAVARPRST